MTVYLGALGRLVELWSTPAAQVSLAERYTFTTTLEGRVKAQSVPSARRSWSLNAEGASPREQAALQEFATGAWGRGPFVFVSADAPVVNLLTPEESSLDPVGLTADVLGSPPMLTPDGWAGRSLLKRDGQFARVATDVPVIPGRRVTGSAYVRGHSGTALVRLVFYRADGTEISRADSPSAVAEAQRRWVTATAPSDAAWAALWVTGTVTQVARPAVTWTSEPFEYGDGQGCRKAVVHGASRDLRVASQWQAHTGRWSDLSFTVQEVG